MFNDDFIPIQSFSSRYEYFTQVYKPAEFHPEHRETGAEKYEALYKSLLRDKILVTSKNLYTGETATFAPGFISPSQKPQYRPTLKLEFQGRFVAAAVRYPSDRKYSRHKRGKVTGFSAGSRTRMFDMFHKMEYKTKPIFVTLTYMENWYDAAQSKAHLRAFLERIRRAYPHASGIWRMEFQERGAPHFHIIFFKLGYIKKEKVQAMWAEIIGEKGSKPFTRIEQIKKVRGVMFYVSKYVAKFQDGGISGFNSLTYLHAYQEKYGEFIGRVWGKFQAINLPFAEVLTIERDFIPTQFYKFRALAEGLFPKIADYISPGFRLYVESAKQWEQIARHLFDPYRPPTPLTL